MMKRGRSRLKTENAWIVDADQTWTPGHVRLGEDGQLPGAVGFAYPSGEGFRTYTLTYLPHPLSWWESVKLLWTLRLWRRTSLPIYRRTRGVTAVCWTCRRAVGAGDDHAAAEMYARTHKIDHGYDHLTLLVPDEVADENLLPYDDVEARTVGELREACGVKLNPSVKIPGE